MPDIYPALAAYLPACTELRRYVTENGHRFAPGHGAYWAQSRPPAAINRRDRKRFPQRQDDITATLI